MKKLLVLAGTLSMGLLPSTALAQTTVMLGADRDNSLYTSTTGSSSNGLGSRMFVGRAGNGTIIRGILHFDLAGAVPFGAIVTHAELRMTVEFSASGATLPVAHSVHRALQAWGVGTTLASSGQGGGGSSTPDSVTWIHTFFPGSFWTTPGGDFAAAPSDTRMAPVAGPVAFDVSTDVQGFVAQPTSNAGWIVKADDEPGSPARVYTTREGGASAPLLVVTYDMPVGNSLCGPAVPNGAGLSARIGAQGSPLVANNSLTLTASALPAQAFGFFLASDTTGFVMNPGGSFGNLCLGGTIGRFQMMIQNSGANGAFSIPVDLTAIPQPSGTTVVLPGDTYTFQAWYRDTQAGNPGSNFTDSVQID